MDILPIFLDLFLHLKVVWDVLRLIIYALFLSIQSVYRFFVPVERKSLIGEIILITGSGNGIGKEICRKLSMTGATLVCWDISKRDNEKTISELKELGTKAYGYEVDISDRSKVEAMADRVRREVGDVSIVINNAGIMPCDPFLSHNPNSIERVFKVNVLAHFWILREFLPKMIEKKQGHIVTLCSAAGLVGTRNLVPYCSTKHAVHGYLEALKDELSHNPEHPDIKMTTVYPYSCNTGLLNNVAECKPRFPSLLPVIEPSYVAHKLVEGMRRNEEYVYCPPIIEFLATYAKVFHVKVQRALNEVMEAGVFPK